jgi:glutamate synthase domain-containing protein 1
MAFDSDKPSNMFDGPMALTRERDACGVGFIANTKSGGKEWLCMVSLIVVLENFSQIC